MEGDETRISDESGSSTAIPSNEEIIEEVMKGVEGCLVKEDVENCDDLIYKLDSNGEDTSKTKDSCEGIDVNKSEEDEDFIDEEALKNVEGSLSQEEKELRRDEAEGHKGRGNECFKTGEYRSSIEHYTLGLRICPLGFPKERAILYANRAAAKMKLMLKESAIEDSTKAVELDPSYLKPRYRRALLYEETEKFEESLADYQEIIKLDPTHQEAVYATKRLPIKIQERDEKMKKEMFAKLKDLGNMILRPFNLSTDNFQLNQDPNTGGYSVNFRPNSS